MSSWVIALCHSDGDEKLYRNKHLNEKCETVLFNFETKCSASY